jgi:hypothetical protein
MGSEDEYLFIPGTGYPQVQGTLASRACLQRGQIGSGNAPVFHKCDETIRGHVFCSFLALVLKKELNRRLGRRGHCFEWADIKQDLKSLQEIIIEENGDP